MAKRYHQTVKDRMSESRGMERAMYRKRAMDFDEPYAGMEPRRRHELEDAGMIHEDHSQIANLPQGVIYKTWEDNRGYVPEVLDDTMHGIDKQIDLDHSKQMKNFVPKKV